MLNFGNKINPENAIDNNFAVCVVVLWSRPARQADFLQHRRHERHPQLIRRDGFEINEFLMASPVQSYLHKISNGAAFTNDDKK